MNKRTLTFPTFTDAADAVVRDVGARKIALDRRHVVVVPDKYTLYYERRLFGGGGAFDVEVLTLNRLFQRVVPLEAAYLSRQGAVMLLRGIVSENADKLRCFRRSASFRGFAEKLYDAFTQFLSSDIDVDALDASGALGIKLADVKLLYRLYREATAGRYVDAAGRLELLKKYAGDRYIAGSHLYAAGFYGMTRQTAGVIDALADTALSLTVYDCQPKGGKKDGAVVYAAPDDVSAVKAAARRIRNLVCAGEAYGDMCVVTGSDTACVKRIFAEHDIPFFADSATLLSAQPLSRFVLTALDCVTRGYRRRDMIRLAKNPCAGADKRDADAFENYANAFLVDYLGFFRPFEADEEGRAERVRKNMQDLLEPFARAVKAAASPELLARAVSDLIRAFDDRAAEKLRAILAQLSGLLPARCPLPLMLDCLSEGIGSAKLGTLPQYTDTVTVGAPEVFRGQRYKHVFILGFNDGVLPAYVADEGLFTDRECAALGDVEPTTAQINARAAAEIRQIALDAPDLFITVTVGGGGRPSGVLTGLLGKNTQYLSHEVERGGLLYESGQALFDNTLAYCADRPSALELLLTGVGEGLPTASSIAAAVPGSERYLSRSCADAPVVSAPLYFAGGRVGVTELGCYFDCPRMHFYRYGLGLKKREDGALTGLDVGNLLHAAAECFASLPDEMQTETEARRIVGRLAAAQPKYRLEQNAPLFKRLEDEAVKLCGVIRAQLSAGSYTSLAREAAFGEGRDLPGLPLKTGAGTVVLSGKIDRIDTAGDFVRVIDYKTGSAGFKYAGIWYGRQLQLPLYLRVAKGNRVPGGMFYFPFKAKWADDEKGYLLDGMFNASSASLAAHDGSLAVEGRCRSRVIACSAVCKDGVVKANRSPKAATADQIEAVCDYAVAAAEQAAAEIADGYAAPKPLDLAGKRPCAYCEYAPCCAEISVRFGGSPSLEAFLPEERESKGERYELE